MPPSVYEKAYARDFALGTLELWYRGEASDPRQYTNLAQPYSPYTLFWRAGETVTVYVDRRGIEWIKDQIRAALAKDPSFLRHVGDEYRARFEEIKSIVETEPVLNKIPERSVLEERSKGYLYTAGRLYPVSAKEEIEKEFNLVITLPESTARVFKGKPAYPGRVTGRVRRVFGVAQVKEFKEGEILVAASTTLDLLPAMKRAAAFVSDEGGIICHAAIVAREMRKPCVIGTKTALDSLRDGDLVEVDAEKGIVTLLERAPMA